MNNNQKLKDIFKQAAELAKDLPDPVKAKAFEIAVTRLSGQQKTNKSLIGGKETSDKKGFFNIMTRETGLAKESLKTVYKLEGDNSVRVIAVLKGGNAEKQRSLALLYLLANKLGFQKDWVSSLGFGTRAKHYGINDGHISQNLKNEKGILHSGTGRGKEYGLTPSGIKKAKEILQGLARR